jgi:hypothetical protein
MLLLQYSDVSSEHMEQVAEPKNDYFCCKALLQFPLPGIHQVVIDTVVVDQSDQEWTVGTKKTLTIKSYDDAVVRQQQLYNAQRQNQLQQQRAAQQQQL